MSSDLEMDPSEVRRLLDELVRRLEAAGVEARIHVIGGSAMALLFPDDADTRMTRDIDASIEPSAEVSRVVKEMSLELGLSPSWLNANGRGFIPPRDDTTTSRSANGVTVTFADARELIATTISLWRLRLSRAQRNEQGGAKRSSLHPLLA